MKPTKTRADKALTEVAVWEDRQKRVECREIIRAYIDGLERKLAKTEVWAERCDTEARRWEKIARVLAEQCDGRESGACEECPDALDNGECAGAQRMLWDAAKAVEDTERDAVAAWHSRTGIEMRMAEKEQLVLEYLRNTTAFVGPEEIGCAALYGSKVTPSSWASPVCKSLVAKGLVERNEKGHYRIKEESK